MPLLVGLALLFSAAAVVVQQRLGRRGLAAWAGIWFLALSWHAVAAVPSHNLPLHDFERSPLPGVAMALGSTTAAAVVVLVSKRTFGAPAQALLGAVGYFGGAVVGLLVGMQIA